MVMARIAGLRPGTSPPPVRMAMVPFEFDMEEKTIAAGEFGRSHVASAWGGDRSRHTGSVSFPSWSKAEDLRHDGSGLTPLAAKAGGIRGCSGEKPQCVASTGP